MLEGIDALPQRGNRQKADPVVVQVSEEGADGLSTAADQRSVQSGDQGLPVGELAPRGRGRGIDDALQSRGRGAGAAPEAEHPKRRLEGWDVHGVVRGLPPPQGLQQRQGPLIAIAPPQLPTKSANVIGALRIAARSGTGRRTESLPGRIRGPPLGARHRRRAAPTTLRCRRAVWGRPAPCGGKAAAGGAIWPAAGGPRRGGEAEAASNLCLQAHREA
mmetsp:Transcript_98663/g.283592  ORF Transcript_98663/g.283592 Transcript_98663/m.283592 type:complete len:218 (-) Transcript_98663:508-1161(-)